MSGPGPRAESERELDLALTAAGRAGRAVMRSFGREQRVTHKAPDQPLTPADLEADQILKRSLLAGRPEVGWLSEETADGPDRLARRRVWIVDPIDGTRSFIAGRPEFAISIGLVGDGAAVLGVVYNPAADELYWAVRGGGAWALTVEPDRLAEGARERPQPLVLDPRPAGDGVVMLASRSEIAAGEFEPFRAAWRIRPTGSTALKLARLAAGAGDAYVSRGPKSEWDVCAGALLVEEAGGRVTDVDGGDLRYNRPDPYVRGIVAARAHLHGEVLGLVGELPPPPRLARRPEDPLHPGLGGEDR